MWYGRGKVPERKIGRSRQWKRLLASHHCPFSPVVPHKMNSGGRIFSSCYFFPGAFSFSSCPQGLRKSIGLNNCLQLSLFWLDGGEIVGRNPAMVFGKSIFYEIKLFMQCKKVSFTLLHIDSLFAGKKKRLSSCFSNLATLATALGIRNIFLTKCSLYWIRN